MDEFQIHRHWPAGLFPFGYPIRPHPSKLTLPPSSFLFISSATVLALAACGRHLELANRPFDPQLLLSSLYSPHPSSVVFLRDLSGHPPAAASIAFLPIPQLHLSPHPHPHMPTLSLLWGKLCALLTVSHKVMLSLSYVHDVPLSGDISTSLG